jgi:hypothetical protein
MWDLMSDDEKNAFAEQERSIGSGRGSPIDDPELRWRDMSPDIQRLMAVALRRWRNKRRVRSNPWKARVRKVYSSLEELEAYDEIYGIVRALGYRSARKLWEDNPFIGGSVYPEDFRLMRPEERLPRRGEHLPPARRNPESSEEDWPEKVMPDEEDIVINDSERQAFYAGKLIAETRNVDWDELSRQITEWMDKNKYWPDVWHQDDHGGWHLVTEDIHRLACPPSPRRAQHLKRHITVRRNTGEPDQDYDHKFFDEIVRQLAKKGFKGATHRQFDLYQGVYLSVPSIDTFWIADSYSTGMPERRSPEKWRKAELVGPDDGVYSWSRGDYFTLPTSQVLEGYLLRLQTFDGKWKEIENPKVGDLPDITEVRTSFKYKKGTRTDITIFQGEKTGKTAAVVQTEDGAVDAGRTPAAGQQGTNGDQRRQRVG